MPNRLPIIGPVQRMKESLEDGEQYRQEHGQPYPDRIDVEILADTGADAAPAGVSVSR